MSAMGVALETPDSFTAVRGLGTAASPTATLTATTANAVTFTGDVTVSQCLIALAAGAANATSLLIRYNGTATASSWDTEVIKGAGAVISPSCIRVKTVSVWPIGGDATLGTEVAICGWSAA